MAASCPAYARFGHMNPRNSGSTSPRGRVQRVVGHPSADSRHRPPRSGTDWLEQHPAVIHAPRKSGRGHHAPVRVPRQARTTPRRPATRRGPRPRYDLRVGLAETGPRGNERPALAGPAWVAANRDSPSRLIRTEPQNRQRGDTTTKTRRAKSPPSSARGVRRGNARRPPATVHPRSIQAPATGKASPRDSHCHGQRKRELGTIWNKADNPQTLLTNLAPIINVRVEIGSKCECFGNTRKQSASGN